MSETPPDTPPETPAETPSRETLELDTPVFLVAMPQVMDYFFQRSVVLLIHHEEEGSLGFIVNRPTDEEIAEILKGMNVTWCGDRSRVAHFGGPVQPQLGTVMYRGEASPEGVGRQEIIPGLQLSQSVQDLEHLAAERPEDVRLFLGYAGWGQGQLEEELLRNDWLTAPVDVELVFDEDPLEAWKKALRSVGVDPGQLAMSAPVDGDIVAN